MSYVSAKEAEALDLPPALSVSVCLSTDGYQVSITLINDDPGFVVYKRPGRKEHSC